MKGSTELELSLDRVQWFLDNHFVKREIIMYLYVGGGIQVSTRIKGLYRRYLLVCLRVFCV